MKTFFHVEDIGDLKVALKEALEVKNNPFAWQHLRKEIKPPCRKPSYVMSHIQT